MTDWLENMDVNFKKKALRCYIICGVMIVVCAVITTLLVTETEIFNRIDLDMFETVAEAPVKLVTEHNVEEGDFGLTTGISDYIVHEDSIAVEVFGSNNTSEPWVANSRYFVLSGFDKNGSEQMLHYYPDNWNDFTVEPNGKYVCRLSFSVPDIQKKIDEGCIFTVSSFRNAPDRSTVEIVVNNESFN